MTRKVVISLTEITFGGLRTLMVILCFIVVSCSTTKNIKQDQSKHVQPEYKQSGSVDKNRSARDKIKQQDKSNQVNNHQENSSLQEAQQETNASNYSSDIESARTSREKAEQTEDKLDASLRDFDEMLLKKNEELSKLSRKEGGSEGSGYTNQGGTESGLGENSDGSVSASRGPGQSVAGVRSQDNEFDNDDVVARQIREAAEKETDPELKKKLWAEYKKYKAGS